MNMDTLDPRREAADVAQGRHDHHARSHDQIVEGNRVTFDVPLSDSFDAAYLNPPALRQAQGGPEQSRGRHDGCEVHVSRPHRTGRRRVAARDRSRAGQTDQRGAVHAALDERRHRRMGARHRFRRHAQQHDVRIDRAAASPSMACTSSTRFRLRRRRRLRISRSPERRFCSIDPVSPGQGVWPVVTQVGVMGPNVVLNFKSTTAGIAPHQRWAAGLLVDSSEFTGGTDLRPNIAFSNREYAGSGHGWSVGWAVAWNVKAEVLLVQQPPGSRNWCIGCTGRFTPILWHKGSIPIPESPSETHESPGRAGDACESVSRAVARSTRRAGPAKYRSVIAKTGSGAIFGLRKIAPDPV